jgi:hypothetical protein
MKSASGCSTTKCCCALAPADQHGWNEYGNYLLIHERHIQAFMDEGFVLSDGLNVIIARDRQRRPVAVSIEGRLTCINGLFVDIEKHLDVMERGGRIWVRLGDCKYHAGIAGEAPRTIFRYDTAHPYPHHKDNYHKHHFNHVTWEEIGTPEWIGRRDWPHLSEVLAELQAWWQDTGQNLDF